MLILVAAQVLFSLNTSVVLTENKLTVEGADRIIERVSSVAIKRGAVAPCFYGLKRWLLKR